MTEEELTFVEFIEEDDGSRTMVARDANGVLHEFRGVKIMGELEDPPGLTSRPVSFVVTGKIE